VFARRLKVQVAYHSAHMNFAFGEYSESIANLEPMAASGERPIMVSSVTGSEIEPELLGPYYWARNLISPVLFADAVKELVSPADGDGKNAVDLLIEIGPHRALDGPVEQILSYHGIKNIRYMSVLTRDNSSLDSSLDLARELFLQGVALDIQQVNGDSQCRLLMHLPPYQWNHSKKFCADSRLQKEMLSQKFPTRSIIGAPVPMMDESQHVWRSFVRLEEESWIRGHTVGTTVLFPAAGMISMVLEATQQVIDPGRTACTFRLRDISFFAALVLAEEVATEVIIHLRPHLIATSGLTTAAWWEFTVSSCVGADQLRDNSRGLVTIDYEENKSQQMASEDAGIQAAQIADYHRIRDECSETYSKENFYHHMTKAAWRYGELFQGVENCHPGYGKTTFDVRLVDIGDTFSKGQVDRPFLINGAALDAIFQSWLGSTYNNGAFEFDKPFVPIAIGELEISVDIPAEAGYVMPGLCRSRRYGFNELSADIIMFDKKLSKVFLSVIDFRTSELEMEPGRLETGGVEVDPADITSEIQWNYALGVMEPAEISQALSEASTCHRLTEVVLLCSSSCVHGSNQHGDRTNIVDRADMEDSLSAWCSTIIQRVS
jgi:acyl transferase domain-containing protein